MRLLPLLAGFSLLTAAAAAQPAPGPVQDPGPPPPSDQTAPAPDQTPPPSDQTAPPPEQAQPQQDQPPPPPPSQGRRLHFRQRFEAANVTHDGKLTLEQAQSGGMRGVVRHFDQIDAEHKGYVTL